MFEKLIRDSSVLLFSDRTTPACSATYYYAHLPQTGTLTDINFEHLLGSGVPARYLGAMFRYICIRNLDLIRVANPTTSGEDIITEQVLTITPPPIVICELFQSLLADAYSHVTEGRQ